MQSSNQRPHENNADNEETKWATAEATEKVWIKWHGCLCKCPMQREGHVCSQWHYRVLDTIARTVRRWQVSGRDKFEISQQVDSEAEVAQVPHR